MEKEIIIDLKVYYRQVKQTRAAQNEYFTACRKGAPKTYREDLLKKAKEQETLLDDMTQAIDDYFYPKPKQSKMF